MKSSMLIPPYYATSARFVLCATNEMILKFYILLLVLAVLLWLRCLKSCDFRQDDTPGSGFLF